MPENFVSHRLCCKLKIQLQLQHPPFNPRAIQWIVLKMTVQIPNSSSRNAVQITHNTSILGDQIPQPRGNLGGVIH